jgi:transcriptional regulator with XRE-family HTH domain
MVIFRAATGLSQLELAQLLGWSQSTVSLIEKGQRDTLCRLNVSSTYRPFGKPRLFHHIRCSRQTYKERCPYLYMRHTE